MTPIKPDIFECLLTESNYNVEEKEFVVDGFRNGFSLGYKSDKKVKVTSPNLKFTIGDETELWNKVMKEVSLKRYASPFKTIPFEDDYIQSPIGLVPKDQGKNTRLIFHLSYPRNLKLGTRNTSVNANTPKSLCSVKYPDFSEVVQLINTYLKQSGLCVIGKSDVTSAFRQLCISKKYWRYLIMKARSPIDHEWYFFIDKCLPFGASISCSHFQRVSNAIAHIVKFKTKKDLLNYLDDFLFATILRSCCNRHIDTFIAVCNQIGMPVTMDKTFWACEEMTFLGFLLNTIQ